MSKELEAFSKEKQALDEFLNEYLFLCEKLHTNMQEKMLLDSNSPYNVLKTYLESIDNANPSDVSFIWLNQRITRLEDDLQYYTMVEKDKALVSITEKELNHLITIKQALLKAQESKQYLKWEDLKKLGKEIKVKLNGAEYLLCKRIVLGFSEFYLYPKGNQRPVLICLGDNDYEKQFFNDLHLERVEE